ncbi:phospholipase A2, partial [Vandammella animalimorsus]|uniref:phospholipase A2 n=1 Tax=Vandammella animalimorsus TaxID=2029117 RepID=UPI0023B0B0A3
STEINIRFPGQYYDQETGTHYNFHRDYDPSTGRYLQSDPIGLDGGINVYLYANGSPTLYMDHLGLETCGSGWNEKLVPDNPFGYQFSNCCREHDQCYGNLDCFASKRLCDRNFRQCMLAVCDRVGSQNPEFEDGCRAMANAYYKAVKTMGFSAFCTPERKSRCPCNEECQDYWNPSEPPPNIYEN